MSDRLCVVMPVYNEEEVIGCVLKKWSDVLTAFGIDFTIRPYNDGSKDSSLKVMRDFAVEHPDAHVEVKDKPNGGHGNTILTGYREASADGFDWIFQVDSDDKMGPEKFGELWAQRVDYDFLVGIRNGRVQALPRKVISFVSRCCVKIFYGRKTIWDVNTPYRLMRAAVFAPICQKIPLTTFAPNVILSGMVARNRLRFFETRVPQHDRTTGEVSIKKWKLLKAAARSFGQTIRFALIGRWDMKHDYLLRYLRYALLAIGALICIRYAYMSLITGMRQYDFQYNPVRILWGGENPYLYSLRHIKFDGWQIDANVVPSCLALLLPFAFFPRLAANIVWAFCNLGFTLVFLYYLYKLWFEDGKVPRAYYWLFAFLLITGTPWRVLVGNGQHLMFSLAFFMAAYYYAQKRDGFLSGVLLALSAFKYTTIAPLGFIFVFRKWWKSIAVAGAIHVALTLAVSAWLHESPVTLIKQSLEVAARLAGQGSSDVVSLLMNWGVNVPHWVITMSYLVFALLCAGACFVGGRSTLIKLSFFAVISNVMCYHRVYDFVVLLIPAVCLLRECYTNKARSHVGLALLAVVVMVTGFHAAKTFGLFLGSGLNAAVWTGSQHVLLVVIIIVDCMDAWSKRGVQTNAAVSRRFSIPRSADRFR